MSEYSCELAACIPFGDFSDSTSFRTVGLPGISGPTANASANTIACWLGSQDWLRLDFFQLGFSYDINYIKALTVLFSESE